MLGFQGFRPRGGESKAKVGGGLLEEKMPPQLWLGRAKRGMEEPLVRMSSEAELEMGLASSRNSYVCSLGKQLLYRGKESHA